MHLAEIVDRLGDYAEATLAVQAEREDVINAIVDAAAPRILERPGPALCFGVTVKHARRLAAAFTKAGVSTACIWGDQPAGERQTAFNAWQTGQPDHANTNEDCAAYNSGNDRWADLPCTNHNAYICELF